MKRAKDTSRSVGPIWIRHRVNRVEELQTLESTWGAEIDLRADTRRPEKIYLAHDPWSEGDAFEAWLDEYVRLGLKGPIALNTKEDGMESVIFRLLEARGLHNFFFVDTPLPTLVRWTHREARAEFSVRFSRFEPAAGVEIFRGKADWVWVDCFGAAPVDFPTVRSLSEHFKICLVSPELQGGRVEELEPFATLLPLADAVCTKNPRGWQGL